MSILNRKALGIGLSLLTIALFVGPIAYAFYTHGWDVEDTITPSEEEIAKIQDRVKSAMGETSISEEDFKIVGYDITENDITLEVNFSSLFEFESKLKEINLSLYHTGEKENLATVKMQSENITLNRGDNERITLYGETTSEGKDIIQSYSETEILKNLEISRTYFEFEAKGITIEIEWEA